MGDCQDVCKGVRNIRKVKSPGSEGGPGEVLGAPVRQEKAVLV